LLPYLQGLSRTGLLGRSRSWAKNIQRVAKAVGEVNVDCRYEKDTGSFVYGIKGEDIAIDDYACKKCLIKGTKNGNEWVFDDWQLDQASVHGRVERQQESWKVDNLEFQYGRSLSMVLDGDFLEKEKALHARVGRLDIDLSQLHEWPALALFLEKYSPHGKMLGKGEIKIEFLKNDPGWRAEAILDTTFSSWDVNGMFFEDAHNVSCHFISDKGMVLRHLNTSLISPDDDEERAKIAVEKIDYAFYNSHCLFEGLFFDVPSRRLSWLADTLAAGFPDFFVPAIGEVVRDAKQEGRVRGQLRFEMSPPYLAMRLNLDDGRYHFLGSEHDLSHFVLEYDPFAFTVASQYMLCGNAVWLSVRSNSPTLAFGELFLSNHRIHERTAQSMPGGVYMTWENNPLDGFSLVDMRGTFQGLAFHLQRDETEPLSGKAMHLIGTVGVNCSEARVLFPDELAHQLKNWKVGGGYQLRGKWQVDKDPALDDSERLHFTGAFEGRNFDLDGYRFDSLRASLNYAPHAVHLRDIHLIDMAGTLQAEQIHLWETEEKCWCFALPQLNVQRFRPSLLMEEGQPRPFSKKPLIIRELQLTGCQGSLADTTTVVGKGNLRFLNRSRKLLQNTIFQIPAEILSRIGLDLSVLTPVTGTINYVIQNGNIHLTKFKDMYSEGKLSRFYLPSSPIPSVIDFDGNLNVQVRMKQYNLLFKLAELFTFSIQGTLQKPTYSIQKQRREEGSSRKFA
ncbi:MAG: hypothetical protein WB791_06620, partial [Waddliaceae bacterium]